LAKSDEYEGKINNKCQGHLEVLGENLHYHHFIHGVTDMDCPGVEHTGTSSEREDEIKFLSVKYYMTYKTD
jgi:uncharacterized protein YfaT (DUF1175 family)